MSNEILKMLCPNFPSDREVSATMSREVWYKVVGNILYVPPESYLRVAPTELDRYGEALLGFEKLNLALHAQGNSRWLIPWEMYKSESLALQVIEYLSSNATFITCDIECSHLGWDDNNMLLLGLKMRGEFKVHLIACFTPNVCKALSDMFAHKNIKFLWHNGKFDISRIHYILKVRARVDEDTMLLHYVGINERKGTHGLKDLAPLYLQAPQWDDKLDDYKKKLARQMRINVTDLRYDYIPLQVLCPYNAMDVYATEQLYDLFMQLRRPESERIYRMLMEASNVYAQVEENGFMLDEDYLNVLHIELANDAEDAVDEMERVANKYWDPVAYVRDTDAKSFPGAYFNHKSPKQLMWLLKKITGQDISSTNAEILEELYEIYPDQDFLKALLKVRTLDKQIDTYVAGIRNVKCNDGRVRASFKLHGTETGRLSCSDPNMQNIPRDAKIKNIFKAAPGKILVNLDYSQAELRVLAYLTQDPWLMDIFIKGQDLHNMVSISIFGEGFTKEQRMQAKAVNFGITYGRGAGSLSKEFSLTRSEGFNLIQKWYAPMPYVKKWIMDMRRMPTSGQESTSLFGRVRHFVVTNKNLNAIQNEAVNFPVSSVASDLTVLSLLEIDKLIQNSAYSARIRVINNVHDSIIFECDDDKEVVDWLVYTGTTVMKEQPIKQFNCNVPFKADAETGYSWGELHGIV